MPAFEFWVAQLTLMDADYQPLPDLISAHLNWLKVNGAGGILVLGTTGEFPSLSVAQRMTYLESVLKVNPGLPVMVNIGAAALADILALQAHALAQPGVNSLLMMPPFYFPDDSINGLTALVQTILAVQPDTIPFYLYHYPKLSQVDILPQLLEALPRIAGIKDTSGDFERIGAWTARFKDRKTYVGTDFEISRSRALGCSGVISGFGNLFPALITQAIAGNAHAEVRLKDLRGIFDTFPKFSAMKAYLNHLALCPNTNTQVFLPFAPLSDAQSQQLIHSIEQVLA